MARASRMAARSGFAGRPNNSEWSRPCQYRIDQGKLPTTSDRPNKRACPPFPLFPGANSCSIHRSTPVRFRSIWPMRSAALPRVASQHGDSSAVGIQDPQDHAKRGGFARTVGADEAIDRALGHDEVEIIDGQATAEPLRQLFEFKGVVHQAIHAAEDKQEAFSAGQRLARLSLRRWPRQRPRRRA